MLRIHLFGQPHFSFDGQPFKFAAPPKALALLAYVLLNRAKPIARDSLAFKLWPDETEDEARTKLRYYLNYLKNALPPPPEHPWVLADGESVQWNPAGAFWLDVVEFEREAAQPATRAHAVELYSGDLLENLHDDWLFPARERYRSMQLDSLATLLLESRSRRDFPKAIAYAQRILIADPWREDIVRQLMGVRYEGGDRAGALREYDGFAKQLRDEMDVDPMPETTALRDAIARGAAVAETLQAGGPEQAADERPAAPLLPLVGRDAEIEQLRALWTRAAHGRGGVVLVGGEAGIGKSRLASELALLVGAQGGRALTGTTLQPESVPYQSIVESLRSAAPLLASVSIEPLLLSAVAHIVPDVRARRADLPALPALDPSRERLRLFEAVTASLAALAKPRPVLVVLEDLHWAGDGTIAALEFLARRVLSLPLLIVGTYRSEETRPGELLRDLRRRLQREGLLSHIDLARLAESAVHDLFARMPELAERGASVGTAFGESEGNPLFLNEFVRDVVASAPHAAGRQGFNESIRARVGALSERARFVAQTAAVVGVAFDVDTIKEISGWAESETLGAVDELVREHLVRETGRRAAFDYAFSHHVVQAAIYGSIEREAAARWHGRAARAIQALHQTTGDTIAGVVAHHFDKAGDAAEAAQQYLRAARNADAVFAEADALQYAARALELSTDPALTYDLLALQESLFHRLGRRREQTAVLDRLEALARESSDPGRLCDALSRRVALHRILGERDAERKQIEALAAAAGAAGDPHWRAQSLLADGIYTIRAGDAQQASALFDQAASLAAANGDVAAEARARCELAYIGTLQGRTAEAEAALAKAQAAAEASGNQALLARTLHAASTAAVLREDFAQAQEYSLRALEIYHSIGDREGEADCCARLATAAARRLVVDAAHEWYAKARALYTELGKRRGQAEVLLNSGVLDFMVGLIDEAAAACQEAQKIFVELDDLLGVALSMLNSGMAKYLLGEYAEAKRLSQTAVELARKVGSKRAEASALGNLGAVERELGEFDASIEHLRASLALRGEAGGGPDGAQDLAELAMTYMQAGDRNRAREIADQLMALDERAFETATTPQVVPWAAFQAYRASGLRERAKEAQARWLALRSRRVASMPVSVRAAYERLRYNQDPALDGAPKKKKRAGPKGPALH